MSTSRYFKCRCQDCGGPIEYPIEGVGTSIACPHCGAETILTIAEPSAIDRATSRSRAWAIGGVIVLVFLLIAAFVAVHLLRDLAPRVRRAQARNVAGSAESAASATAASTISTVKTVAVAETDSLLANEFTISPVGISTQPGSALRHATGTVVNISGSRRIGLTIDLQLLDENGRGLQQIRDYRPVLEPAARWDFRALVLNPKATSARIIAVRDDR